MKSSSSREAIACKEGYPQGEKERRKKHKDALANGDALKPSRRRAAKAANGTRRHRRAKVAMLNVAAGVEDVTRLAARLALRELGASLDHPVQLVDLGQVENQVRLWRRFLPQVRPHYAVKCSPDKEVIRELHKGGCGFDCATMQELSAVLSMGVSPDDIVYSHPCKPRSHIAFAKSRGVSLMSFDNAGELHKIAAEFPQARLLLRLVCEDSSAQCPMSLKFGAARDAWPQLLNLCQELNLQLAGISFHVGSGCKDPESFEQALRDAKEVFEMIRQRGMEELRLLDIGGGFPGDEASFAQVAPIIAEKLLRLFPSSDYPELHVMAEPGRFFAASTAHLLTKVYAKAKLPAADGKDGEVCRYYVNDGLYGSFNCIIYDHVSVYPEALEDDSRQDVPCAVFGPTCDGFDVILEKHVMPELEEGEWVLWRSMGAYTSAAGSQFNGFPKAKTWYYRLAAENFAEDQHESDCADDLDDYSESGHGLSSSS
eukprot:gb/GFBE01041262.1/.p1 GENE.gb/GFBE01041262.1/~~gb/GFBE01041262.1/.p1  ORF type:complete len:485 (+),score=115.96 gb/GFBE01041262.1/:1-1455(+)